MGHMNPRNISKYILYRLFEGCFDEEGMKESPNKITIPEFVNYFTDKIDRMNGIIFRMKNNSASNLDIRLLIKLKEENYGVSCSEAVYFDKGMIEFAISDCLYFLCKSGIIDKIDNIDGLEHDYYCFNLDEYRRLKDETGKEIDDYIIRHIEN